MKNLFNLFIIAIITFLVACKGGMGGSNQKLPNGMEYKIISKGSGAAINVGDNIKVDIINLTPKDSIVYSTINNGQPFEFKMAEPRFGGDLMHIFKHLHNGDSALLFVRADSMFRKTLPPYAKAGDMLKFQIKVLSVMNDEEAKAEQAKNAAAQISIDEEKIEKFITDKGLKANKTESGLRYIMEQVGKGDNPKSGDMVNVHYIGTLLDGTKFDSSLDRNEAFSFPLGQGRVIKGWDEGIALFKKGGKGKLIIPSGLAYGDKAAGPMIQPNSVLVFDIELLDFKPAPVE